MNDPIALPRSSSGKVDSTIAIPVPCVMLAPMPCSALKPMSMSMLSDVLANTPPTTKMTNPPIYTRLRPMISESLPIGSSSALMASAYPISTH